MMVLVAALAAWVAGRVILIRSRCPGLAVSLQVAANLPPAFTLAAQKARYRAPTCRAMTSVRPASEAPTCPRRVTKTRPPDRLYAATALAKATLRGVVGVGVVMGT